ncbi:hypothetical protein ACFQY5_22615 [Paeniroseomonas aquatica]|uniref:hypothetical protein n=1 Tax=Paeniroseomonas aquatica TaxID=373043 RepID=UPI003612F7DE
MPRSLFTCLMHAAIALAVVAQLVGIGLAEPPSHGAPGNLAFLVPGLLPWSSSRRQRRASPSSVPSCLAPPSSSPSARWWRWGT